MIQSLFCIQVNMSQTFNDLKVYQIAKELSGKIERLAKILPRSERFRQTDQILRSSRSINANIAEGFGRKKYAGDFIKFLRYALASSDETQAHLEILFSADLIDGYNYSNLTKQYKNLSVRLINFIKAIQQNNQ